MTSARLVKTLWGPPVALPVRQVPAGLLGVGFYGSLHRGSRLGRVVQIHGRSPIPLPPVTTVWSRNFRRTCCFSDFHSCRDYSVVTGWRHWPGCRPADDARRRHRGPKGPTPRQRFPRRLPIGSSMLTNSVG